MNFDLEYNYACIQAELDRQEEDEVTYWDTLSFDDIEEH
jgi:hypothetical protein